MPSNPIAGAAALAGRAQEVVLRYLTWVLLPLKLSALRAAAVLTATRELNHVAVSGNGHGESGSSSSSSNFGGSVSSSALTSSSLPASSTSLSAGSDNSILRGSGGDTFVSIEAAIQSRAKCAAASTYAGGLVALLLGGPSQPKEASSIACTPSLGLAAWAASHLAAQTARAAATTSELVSDPALADMQPPRLPSPPPLMSSAAYGLAITAATASECSDSLPEDSAPLLASWSAWLVELESSLVLHVPEVEVSLGGSLLEAWQRVCHAEGPLTRWRRALPWAARRLTTAKQHQATMKRHLAVSQWLHSKHAPGGYAPRAESLLALRSARAHLVSASEKCIEAVATSAKAAEAVNGSIAALGLSGASGSEAATTGAAATAASGKGKGRDAEKSGSMKHFKKEIAALAAWQVRSTSARQQLASLASNLQPGGDSGGDRSYGDDDGSCGFTMKLVGGSADGDASGLVTTRNRRITAGVAVATLCAFEEEDQEYEEESVKGQQVSSSGLFVAGSANQQQASLSFSTSSSRSKGVATAASVHLANVARAAAAVVESAAHASRQHAHKVECAQAWRATETRLKHADSERAHLAKQLHQTTWNLQSQAAGAASALREAVPVLFRGAKGASSNSGSGSKSSSSGLGKSSSAVPASAAASAPVSTATKGVSAEGGRSAGSMAEVLALAQSLCKALGVTPVSDLPTALCALEGVGASAKGDAAAAEANKGGGGGEGPLGPLRARAGILAAVAARAAAAEDAIASAVTQPAVAALLALPPPSLPSADEVIDDNVAIQAGDDYANTEGAPAAAVTISMVDSSSVEVLAKAADEAEAVAVAAAEAAGPSLRGAQALVSALGGGPQNALSNSSSGSGGSVETARAKLLTSACVGTSGAGDGSSGKKRSVSNGDWAVTEALLVALVGLARDAASSTRTDQPSHRREGDGEDGSRGSNRAAESASLGVKVDTLEKASDRGEDCEEEEDEDDDDENDDDDDNEESSSDEEGDEGGGKQSSATRAAGESSGEVPGGRASARAPSSSVPPHLQAPGGGRNAHAVALLERVESRLRGGVTPLHPQSFAASPAATGTAGPPLETEAAEAPPGQRGLSVPGKNTSESAESLGVAAQVAWMIQQATSPENLCLMYEGWAPWI